VFYKTGGILNLLIARGDKMNNFLKCFIAAIVILGIVIGILMLCPKNIDLSSKGVMYGLSGDSFKPITLNIKGRVIKNITGDETFRGIIDIDGLEIPVPEEQRYLEAPFTHNSLPIIYVYYVDNAAYNYTAGTLFCDKKWERFTILLEDNNMLNNKALDYENISIISAPSSNKEEGMSISKQLLPQEFVDIYFE